MPLRRCSATRSPSEDRDHDRHRHRHPDRDNLIDRATTRFVPSRELASPRGPGSRRRRDRHLDREPAESISFRRSSSLRPRAGAIADVPEHGAIREIQGSKRGHYQSRRSPYRRRSPAAPCRATSGAAPVAPRSTVPCRRSQTKPNSAAIDRAHHNHGVGNRRCGNTSPLTVARQRSAPVVRIQREDLAVARTDRDQAGARPGPAA